jgi:hypothetical protein
VRRQDRSASNLKASSFTSGRLLAVLGSISIPAGKINEVMAELTGKSAYDVAGSELRTNGVKPRHSLAILLLHHFTYMRKVLAHRRLRRRNFPLELRNEQQKYGSVWHLPIGGTR